MTQKNNLILEIYIGCPASGKSTYAKNFLLKNKNWGRVNRDSFRDMLRCEQFCEPKVENLISKLMCASIDALLAKNINVIVDNTHLKAKYIDELIAFVEHRADVRFRIFDISLDKALERDAAREKKVGEVVLKRMWTDYKVLVDSYIFQDQTKKNFVFQNPPFDAMLPDIYIFDIDGTLAHMNGKRSPFDWNRVDVDDLDVTVASAFRDHMTLGHKIFVLSGRDEESREKTEEWLEFYGLKYEKLLMRKAGDFRKDNIVKEEIYNNYIKGHYNVRVIYDDRQQVVDMWRSLGMKVFQVEKADF